jgi:hypothetical protein
MMIAHNQCTLASGFSLERATKLPIALARFLQRLPGEPRDRGIIDFTDAEKGQPVHFD